MCGDAPAPLGGGLSEPVGANAPIPYEYGSGNSAGTNSSLLETATSFDVPPTISTLLLCGRSTAAWPWRFRLSVVVVGSNVWDHGLNSSAESRSAVPLKPPAINT